MLISDWSSDVCSSVLLELLAQGDDSLLVVHVELFDPHRPKRLQGLGVLRVAHGGGDVPAITEQRLHHTQAQAPGGANDQCVFCRIHERSAERRVGNEWGCPGRSRRSLDYEKKK